MKIEQNVDLKKMSFMRIGGSARYLIEIENDDDFHKLIEIKEKENLPIYILGEGSNTIFSDGIHKKIIVKVQNNEIIKTYENSHGVNIKVGSSVSWDKLVEWTVKNGLSGLELLSAIPGLVGACPVQNIGAYGTEISETLTNLRAFDLVSNEFYEITNKDCQFSYRNSIFKENPNRFVILDVSFRLRKEKPKLPTYKDLALYFLTQKNKKPSLREIRKAVIYVRSEKLPDPSKEPNCGSFFKNPIISKHRADELVQKFPDMPNFIVNEFETKLSGGWLIEKSGFKDKKFGNIKVHNKNSLVLTSNGKANFKELLEVRDKIIQGVEKNFGITIEVEPDLVT